MTKEININGEFHNDIVLENVVFQAGSFIVTLDEDFHVWDISLDASGSDQWQTKFKEKETAIDYAQSRANGGSWCLLSREGHILD